METPPPAASSASAAPAAANGSATNTSASSGGRSRARRRRSAGKRKRSSNGGNSSGGGSSGGGRARPLTVDDNDNSDNDGQQDEANAHAAEPVKKAEKKQKPDKKESKAAAQWGCPACTFLNEPTRGFCEMCGTTNPNPPPTAPSSRASLFDVLSGGGGGAAEWNCAACTMKNPPRARVCVVCGSLNPNPIVPTAALSIMRGSRAISVDSDDSDDDGDDSDGEEGESSNSSDSETSSTWQCDDCEVSGQIPRTATSCPTCCAPRPRSVTSKRLKKSKKKLEAERSRKRRKKSKALEDGAKSAYGVSSAALCKLAKNQQQNNKLTDTLQTLTHTLAMMDASADSEWGDVHGGSLFLRGPGARFSRSTQKDAELLPVLVQISKQQARQYPRETRLLAIQSINYLVKLERDLLSRTVINDITGMYLEALLAWVKESRDLDAESDVRNAQMIVEECVNGISSMSNFEPSVIRELSASAKFAGYLGFLQAILSDESAASAGFHPSVLVTALEILQRCCMKMRWDRVAAPDATSTREQSQTSASFLDRHEKPSCAINLEVAKNLVNILRRVLAHKHVQLHMKAAKCMLMLFHRAPHGHSTVIRELVPAELLREFVRIAVDSSAEESDESRLAVISLLVNLFDTRHELVTLFLHDNIYDEFFKGLVPLLTSSSSAISKHALKLANLLSRVVCRRHSARNRVNTKTHGDATSTNDADEASMITSPRRRPRLNSLPDPNVLTTILLDFIEADSIPAVSTVLKEGADLNFPTILDIHGQEIEKPLHVAVEHASLAMVRFLVKRGADINLDGPNGTALHVAARAGRCDIVSFLLQCGAHLDATDRSGKTVTEVVEEMDRATSGTSTKNGQCFPVKKLLEVYQKTSTLRDDSDLSEADEFSATRRSWRFSSGNGLDFDDEDDEDMDDIDPDDDDDDDEFYGDYDDDGEDDDDMYGRVHHAAGDVDDEYHSDDDLSGDDDDRDDDEGRKAGLEDDENDSASRSTKQCIDGTPSDGGSTSRGGRQTDVAVADERSALASEARGQESAKREGEVPVATSSQMDAFTSSILQCLLTLLRDVDLQNVERSVLSTLASVLEMAPSRPIRQLQDGDIVVLLDTVHFLLQAESKLPTSTGVEKKDSASGSSIGRGDNAAKNSLSAKQKSDLASHILALRILLAVARKSHAESSIFYQIERRGIGEQIEHLNLTSSRLMNLSSDAERSHGTRQTIFERGVVLLRSLRADMMESGMLHLHRLKNLARRLKGFTPDVSVEEKELALVDFVELFEHANSITSYEFKQSMLLPAVLHYLTPGGALDEERTRLLIRALERCPGALNHFISRLQSIVNQEEAFPVLSFCSSRGSELYPLTRQLKITFSRTKQAEGVAGAKGALANLKNAREGTRAIQTSPLTHFQSLERTVFRALPARDHKLSLFYLNLVGYMIQKIVDGKWRKYLVVGYDPVRSYHLLKPEGGDGEKKLVEMVLHDSQCRLLGPVEVFDEPSLDLEIFGPLANGSGSSTPKSGKKRKKSSNKKRKQSSSVDDEDDGILVEVKNTAALVVGKLKGAWYAGVLQSNSAGEATTKSSSKSFDDFVQPNSTYTVKMLSGSKTVRNVPAECLRPRTTHPQVGSVVEVDGALGEVTRVYDDEEETSNDPLWDIKVSAEIEKMRVTKDRARFPPSTTPKSKALEDEGLIEAMSIRRLFPGKESSAIAGRIGDRVWVLPPSGSQVKDISVPGVIKRFPSGLESIRESTTVVVEVSFGSSQPPLSIKVEQDRLLNFALGGPQGGNPSRLLAALQGHARSGVGFLSDQNCSLSLREAFERITGARSLHGSQGGIVSSASSISRLQGLLSSHSPNDSATRAGGGVENSPGADTSSGAVTGSSSSSSGSATRPGASLDGSSSRTKMYRNDAILEHIKHGSNEEAWTCNIFPRVKLLMGLREKRDSDMQAGSSALWKAIQEGEHEEDEDKQALPRPVALLLDADPVTHEWVVKPRVRTVWVEVFNRFDASTSAAQTSRRKKRKLQPPPATTAMTPSAPWDIDKFIAFMRVAFEPAKRPATQQNSATIKHCVLFSKFATVDSRRSLLTSDGFVASMTNVCRDVTKSMLMVKYLRSRGYGSQLSEKRVKAEEKDESDAAVSQGLDSAESPTPQTKKASKQRAESLQLHNFPPDENVLKCLETLREANGSGYSSMGALQDTEAVVPPWKVPFDLQCDFKIEWSGSHRSALASPLILPAPTGRDEVSERSGSDITPSREDMSWLQQLNGALPTSPDARNNSALSESVTDSIRLLRYLFEFRSSSAAVQGAPAAGAVDEDLWTSPRLYNKLESQLQDVLSVCSGIYPKWYDVMITNCKFFFPRRLREQLFRATSFGCTRSLHWFRNQLALDESGNDQLPVRDMGGIYNQDISISPIPKERVKVNRANLLSSAETVMKMHAKRKAILDVVFVGEKGYGSGVTAAFYSATAHALQSVRENYQPATRWWVPGDEDETESARSASDAEAGVEAEDVPVIRHANGLFPFPHVKAPPKVIDRFRMIGRLAGKALMDERLLPLPLSTHFMRLVVGETLPVEAIRDIFGSHGRIIYSMYIASHELKVARDAGDARRVEIDDLDVTEWLAAVDLSFLEPLSQQPLKTGGADIVVTAENMDEYVGLVLDRWLRSGVATQVSAFREGISEVLPLGKLRLLFVPELLEMLCGNDDIDWDAASLLRSMKLAHGYTRDSQPVQYFARALEEMVPGDRRAFLLYATGCPNLPPGGFAALKPQFEVVRRVVDAGMDVDRALPFARTCTNTLHLPAYSSQEVLASQLAFAVANSRGVIDRD